MMVLELKKSKNDSSQSSMIGIRSVETSRLNWAGVFLSGFFFCLWSVPFAVGQKVEPIHTVHLKSGRKLYGVAKPVMFKGRRTNEISVTLPNGTEVRLNKFQYERVTKDSKIQAEYKKKAAGTKQTAKDQWDLALWCKKVDLDDEYLKHARITLELDGQHEPALKACGYVQNPRTLNWSPRNDGLYRMGYRFKGGKAFIPSLSWFSNRIQANIKQDREDRKELNSLLKRIRTSRKPEKRLEAEERLLDLRRPEIVPLAIKQFEKSNVNSKQWLLLLDLISSIETRESLRYQLNFYLSSVSSPAYKKRLIKQIMKNEQKRAFAINHFLSALHPSFTGAKDAKSSPEKITERIDRAADALAELKHNKGITQMINAIYVEYKKTTVEGPKTSVGGGGVSGYNGGKPTTKTRIIPKRSKRSLALLQNVTGQNFQYDQEKWFDWWVQKKDPGKIDLRRDQ